MRTATTLFLLVSLLVGFTACEKEVDNIATGNNSINTGGSGSTNNTNNIEGNYDFVGMEAYTQSTVRVITSSQTVETHTESYYITKNNSGTMTITSNQLIGTNIAYSIDTTMNVKTIVDNVLFDDSDFPYCEWPNRRGVERGAESAGLKTVPKCSLFTVLSHDAMGIFQGVHYRSKLYSGSERKIYYVSICA